MASMLIVSVRLSKSHSKIAAIINGSGEIGFSLSLLVNRFDEVL